MPLSLRFAARGLLILPLVLTLAPVASAQAPADRAALTALRDTLAQAADARAVTDLLPPALAGAARKPDGLIALRLAVIEHQLAGRLDPDPWLDSAETRLERVLRANAGWSEAWYELALVKLMRHETGAVVKDRPFQRAGTDYLHVATDLLLRALTADASNDAAALALGLTVLRQTVQPQLDTALPWVRHAAARVGTPAIHLVRGTLERQMEHPDSAVEAFRTYVATGGDPAIGRLEIVRTLLPLGRSAWAESLYYEGASVASPTAAGLYRWDIAWIADSIELAAFDTAFTQGADSGTAFLRRFWGARDVADARADGERLTEHYRRLDYALRHFRRPVEPRQTTRAAGIGGGNSPLGALRAISGQVIVTIDQGVGPAITQSQQSVGQHIRDMSRDQTTASGYARLTARTMLGSYSDRQMVLDHRGIIYIRHGEPDDRASFGGYDTGANESWKYITPEGVLILHFVGTTQASDLVEQLELNPQLLESRAQLDPRYARLAQGLGLSNGAITLPPHALQEDREQGQRAIEERTTSDTHQLRFERAMVPVVQGFGVRSADSAGGELLLVFAAKAGELTPARVGADSITAYPVRLRVIARRRDGEILRVDTMRVYATRRELAADEFVTGQLALPAPPGEYDLTVVIGDAEWESAARVRLAGLHVPGAEPLAVSDLVLGREGSGQAWDGPEGEVPLNPLNAYPENGSVEVYYQLRGVQPGVTYRTTIQVRRRGRPANEPSVRLAFDQTADAAAVDVARTVGLGRLRRGDYVLAVTIEAPDGRRVVREQYLNVTAR